eukprot:CAMPEP_0117524842 /NCGR_PEP_ID=MMETSP0784-20121206/35459_1 /TAXON_ID=39447 /ORGANISM="" /LENGTH=330 /DNA_ID=CAMNT_0005321013 /DNA_START=48 /DNA_END=1040 /DNA_ORIENTATION=-
MTADEAPSRWLHDDAAASPRSSECGLREADQVQGALTMRVDSQTRVTFESAVHEVRFELCSLADSSLQQDDTPKPNKSIEATKWRATTTADGWKYFFHVGTNERCWDLPRGLFEKSVRRFGACVGDEVEVFSNSTLAWCRGYVEKVAEDGVTVAFQLPDALPNEWGKKVLPPDHMDLRGLPARCTTSVRERRARREPGAATKARRFQDTSLPDNWTLDEVEAYDELFHAATSPAASGDLLEAKRQTDFFLRSGLHERALQECWQVANPDLKVSLGRDEFRACCRLVSHCQSLQRETDAVQARALRHAGVALRTLLRDLLATPSPDLIVFA